jgi:hypothetical protein
VGVARVLAGLHRLEDLPLLAGALGHAARWEEIPLDGWLGLAADHRLSRAALVGDAGGFPWFGIESGEPARTARAVARRLARWGRLGGVLALAPESRRLAVSVAFGDTPALECALDAPDRLSIGCLDRLRSCPEGGPVAYAASAADALAGQGVGTRFFHVFRATLDRMSAALPARCGAAERHGLALLQLTRVLFLYFVQSKGWLDGRADFLAREVDRCLARRRRIQRDLLRPLFFGTLNRPAAERSRIPRRFGRIPFLNGGLFEPHPLERRWRGDMPDAVWRDAFDSLFERFHFTADESGRPGLVAPDMLGRVFEGVMDPVARRRSGTFYTPAALVRGLVRTALAAHLDQVLRCGERDAEHLLAEPSPAARRVLEGLSLLDPAVGSGAFLLGALDLLAASRGEPGALAQAKRRVLRENLFGVDLNPAAVRLTELRLWLAVIADDPAERPEAVEPLPNLDCLVRQGDSLLDPIGAWSGTRAPPHAVSLALARLRRRLVTATGGDKRALARELRRMEAETFAEALRSAEAELRDRIAQSLEEGRQRTLFGERRGLDPALRFELARLRRQLHGVRAARRRFERERELPWFHYPSHFADVFARGGFDLVVGNPPWVRAEQLPRDYRQRLAGRYRWWRSGVSHGFANRPDLSLAFLERAWELVRPDGTLALLLPAKLATAAYGARARHALATGGTLRVVADLTRHPDAVFEATVYPLALVAGKSAAPAGHRVRTKLASGDDRVARRELGNASRRDLPSASQRRLPSAPEHELPSAPQQSAAGVPQRELTGGGPWVLVRDSAFRALADCSRELPRLGDRFTCHLGVKTGANDLFLDPPRDIEPELVRWAVRGRDVRPFRAERRVRLLWPCDEAGRALDALPPRARAHLARADARLRRRADYVGGPAWALFRTGPACAPHRVGWADLARRLTALALSGTEGADRIPLNTCYVVAVPDAETAGRLAAWLNSTWIRAAARLVATPAAGGFARFGAQVVSGLPLPDAVLADADLDALARCGAAGEPAQSELDALTARHLGLGPAAQEALAGVDGVRSDHRR